MIRYLLQVESTRANKISHLCSECYKMLGNMRLLTVITKEDSPHFSANISPGISPSKLIISESLVHCVQPFFF